KFACDAAGRRAAAPHRSLTFQGHRVGVWSGLASALALDADAFGGGGAGAAVSFSVTAANWRINFRAHRGLLGANAARVGSAAVGFELAIQARRAVTGYAARAA